MVYPQILHSCLAIIILLSHLLHFSSISAHNELGFTTKLIRKNSPHLPSHIKRLLFSNNPNTPQSPVFVYGGYHIMEISIGTPPIKIYGNADTGSDLIWTQCVPCKNCYKQLKPLFDPKKSSTYKNISCESKLCHELGPIILCSPQKSCNYAYAYGIPGSYSTTQGALALETVTLKTTSNDLVYLKDTIFGCGHDDNGWEFNDHEMGIIGLGGGSVSFVSQIAPYVGGKIFSHCLVPYDTDIRVSSNISFGKGSEVSGDGVVSTPLVGKGDRSRLYLVTLLGISVENTYLPFNSSSPGTITKGNMLLDSGTPPILLPKSFFDRVVEQVRKKVAMKPIVNDPSLGYKLCYRTRTNLKGPNLTAHFEGADVVLTPTQTFIPRVDGVYCLGFTNTSIGVGVFGNFAQSNYLVGFDLEKQVVSFKPMDCTRH